ncbi:MAG: hypothetical protein L6437_16145 [Kiritimatiellae bacterium]|nr:hypothetical protein [Kiritimatiellia bacterium]
MTKSKRFALLQRRLKDCSPFIRSSVVVTRKPCIRKGCPACKEGRKHESCYLAVTKNGKTSVRYLPKGLVEEARRQKENYRKAQEVLDEMSEFWIEELLKKD